MKIKTKGFTLIELLVVVAIISLLSSIVLAAVRDAKFKAEQRAYKQYLIQVVNAIELYRSSSNSFPASATLETMINNNLSSFIKYQKPPSFVSGTIEYTTEGGGYSCGLAGRREYIIRFPSSQASIDFKRAYPDYNPSGSAVCSGSGNCIPPNSYPVFCVSSSIR